MLRQRLAHQYKREYRGIFGSWYSKTDAQDISICMCTHSILFRFGNLLSWHKQNHSISMVEGIRSFLFRAWKLFRLCREYTFLHSNLRLEGINICSRGGSYTVLLGTWWHKHFRSRIFLHHSSSRLVQEWGRCWEGIHWHTFRCSWYDIQGNLHTLIQWRRCIGR